MKTNSTFSSENLLISVAGHLGILALMITSFAVFSQMDKIVMSDHVQILEIDLTRVQITGDETLVFNTDVPEQTKNEKRETKNEKPKPAEPIGDEPAKELEVPSVVEPPKKEIEPKPEAPKAPTVVRVNRETTSLNRTMTVSVVDALRVAMTRCWVFDRNYPGIDDIRAVAHLQMNQRGYVQNFWLEQESAAAENPSLAYIFETIRTAIANCQPFSMLPESEYDKWKSIQLTFYPSNASVQ